jgi:hypothetical protein
MNNSSGRWIIPGGALVVALVLLAHWLMRPDEVEDVPRAVEATSPVEPQAPAIAEAVRANERSGTPAFATFRGRVINAITKQPVREFEVQLQRTRSAQEGDETPEIRSFRSGDGRFEWPNLPAGEWTVSASADGYERFNLADARLEVGTTSEIVLALRHLPAIRGRVYDEDSGAPIGDARIAVRMHRVGSDPVRGATTANDGTFELENLAPGPVTVGVGAKHYASRDIEVVVGEDTPPLQIGLIPGGTIAGRLVAPDGSPAAGNVSLFELDGHSGHLNSTGPAGQFEYRHLAPGRYRLKGHARGGRATRDITLARSERIEGLILTLTAAHSIRGIVTGLGREELSLVYISVMRDGEELHMEGELDDSGTFAIHGVAPGRAIVIAAADRRQVSETVEMPADSDLTVNLDFPRGARLSGRITRSGEPLRNVEVSPLPPPGVRQAVSVHGTSTSDDGAYTMENLPLGTYVLMINSFQSGLVKVAGDTVFDFEVPDGRLSGRVLAAQGEPIMDALAFMWPDEREMIHPFSGSSDQSGRFSLEGLEPGGFMLTIYKSGYEMFRKHISFDPQTPELTVRLRAEPGVEVAAYEAVSGNPVKSLVAVEVIGSGMGSVVRVELDDDGRGYLPSALAGSTLKFMAPECKPTVIDSWDGNSLDLRLERASAR